MDSSYSNQIISEKNLVPNYGIWLWNHNKQLKPDSAGGSIGSTGFS